MEARPNTQEDIDKALAEIAQERQKIFELLRQIEDHHRWIALLRNVLFILCAVLLLGIFF